MPKAHDMGREFSIISGLGPTAVPVPIAYGYCESPEVTGAHFYVMSQVDGKALFELEDSLDYLTEDARANVGLSFMDVLASLHSVDPDDVGPPAVEPRREHLSQERARRPPAVSAHPLVSRLKVLDAEDLHP